MKISKLNCCFFVSVLLFLQPLFSQEKAENTNQIPQGKLEKFLYKESRIFPGTEREVVVYIPAQIDPATPACVYVQQDGIKEGFNNVLDTLIARKEIPVTVGIFIKPGVLPATDNNTLGRPNRCFEYDGLGDNYVSFLLEEILPYVSSKYKLALSNNGNDRCIGGVSSGGISAFNTAWERPDAFSRVYCISGSFVAFRGGNEFPTLIRKTEAKPIRVFLSTGSDDMKNCAGDWTLLDQEMDRALEFSGYEYQFRFLKGGHGVGYTNLFSEGMKYLWKGWPEAIIAGGGAPRVQDLIFPDQPWMLVPGSYADAQGPACNESGEVFFTDPSNNKIYKIGTDGKVATFIEKAGYSNGLSFGPRGELYAVSAKTGKITLFGPNGDKKTYASGIHGKYILARPEGGVYVSSGSLSEGQGTVWFVDDRHKVIVDPNLKCPTGLAISPDRWLLAVADKESHSVYSYSITSEGLLANKERFFWLHVPDWADCSEAGSVCYDKEGHLYVATNFGVQVCAWDGPTQVILPMPGNEKVTGICIGGAGFDTLYAFCGGKVYERQIKCHTLGPFFPWTKMTPGKL